MAITLAGTNSTITFANSSTQTFASKIINFQRFVWAERVVPTTRAQDIILWQPEPMVTKLQENSYLLVKINLSMRTNYSDHLNWWLSYGDDQVEYQGTMPYDAGFSANGRPWHSVFLVTGINKPGTSVMRLRWDTANNQDGNRPCDNYNPSYIDDNRLSNEYSQMVVFELANA
jgi:hypothetical protein